MYTCTIIEKKLIKYDIQSLIYIESGTCESCSLQSTFFKVKIKKNKKSYLDKKWIDLLILKVKKWIKNIVERV